MPASNPAPFLRRPGLAGLPLAAALGILAVVPKGADTALAESLVPAAPAGEAFVPPHPHLARLGRVPDWSVLDVYQESITREEFVYLLRHCYARSPGEYAPFIRIEEDRALVLRQSNFREAGWYEIRFRTGRPVPSHPPVYWRRPLDLPDLPPNTSRPLEGLRVAIDPGHIGGEWVRWDDRHFRIGKDTIEVREGEMALKVAKILERDLALLGASVQLTRRTNDPVTHERVETLRDEARLFLQRRGRVPATGLVESTAKAMFAISSEIRARADLVNEQFRPDVALCLHFDASPWPPGRPAFRSPNHLHLLINGCYSESEISEDDTRFEMLRRILQRVYHEELALADVLSLTMKRETRLPPFRYDGTNGMAVNDNDYVWARNLLANRVFFCPVVFFEPYCMNHEEVYQRVQEGAYPGLREINGIYRKNLYQEYADGVTAGLVRYYRGTR